MANKTELKDKLQEVLATKEVKVSKDEAGVIIDAMVESIIDVTAEHGKLQLIGFGNFEVRERKARKGTNPQTGEEIDIAANKVPAFKPLKGFKDRIKL